MAASLRIPHAADTQPGETRDTRVFCTRTSVRTTVYVVPVSSVSRVAVTRVSRHAPRRARTLVEVGYTVVWAALQPEFNPNPNLQAGKPFWHGPGHVSL